MSFNRVVTVIKRLKGLYVCASCILVLFAFSSPAQTDTLNALSEVRNNFGGAQQIDLFNKLTWHVSITEHNGIIRDIVTKSPDTIAFGTPASARLVTSYRVSPALIKQQAVLFYNYDGSARIKLNGGTIQETGVYNTADNKRQKYLNISNYSSWVILDTIQKIEIDYTPARSIKVYAFKKLEVMTPVVAEMRKESHLEGVNYSISLGFYYLAFGIVFIILFLFFREKTEHLFFSLFCISVALIWIVGLSDDEDFSNTSIYWLIFALEFLSLFLAKVLTKQDKSYLPLLIVAGISFISWLPFIRCHYVFVLNQPTPFFHIAIVMGLVCYSGLSSAYYLFQGFGQKRWEAKTILFLCLTGLLVSIIIPFILSTIGFQIKNKTAMNFAGNLFYIGMCIYPLSAAIVLGRRNGLNQKKLIKQVASIEALSKENLEKEKEKKEILEAINVELEHKVNERTAEVMLQKEIIEIKNRSITDNLIYAQRIQSAILPDVKLVKKSFTQSFIVYLPKDIVSGDFYSFAEKDGKQIIVAGDCTGHGVSGAFMSMIGSSLLNQIINEQDIAMPAEILNRLNTAVIDTLKQGENESNDGMDIAICSFDFNAKKLHYAGANRPLWIVRDNNLVILKPDKFPIGGLQMARNRVFHTTTVDLQPKDTVYLFTDGFADQFGGENGKKLMIGRFKEMLLGIQELSMATQESYLTASFSKWKGSNEQVDDVLVIGIRY